MNTKPLKIFGYTCYRTYLADFYTMRKESGRGYSYRSFSKAAGFTSPNYLKLVIDGDRNLSDEAVAKVTKAVGLTGKMSKYFSLLVKLNQTKDDDEKQQFLLALKKITPFDDRRDLNVEVLQYLSHWLYPVIKEMIELDEYRDDPYWILRKVNATGLGVKDVTEALNFLKKEKFITLSDEGKWVAQKMVISSDEVRSLAIRKYHRHMMERAIFSLENLPMDMREFGALTVILPEKSIEGLKSKLKDFREEIHKWAIEESEIDVGEVVVQLNFQMFPQTKK